MAESEKSPAPLGLRTLVGLLHSRPQIAKMLGIQYGGKRDIYETLGYSRVVHFQSMLERYHRGGIARRIVDAFPNATWRNPPQLREKKNSLEQTDFEQAFSELSRNANIFHYLRRADSVAGIGHFGILVLGIKDRRSLDQPLGTANGPDDLAFLAVYSEGNVEIQEWDTNPQSPRFGKPTLYRLQPESTHSNTNRVFRDRRNQVDVHHTRVIHVVRNPLEDDIFGIPELYPVWNYLDDLDKIMGGSAEATWRTVDRGIQFDADKDAQLEDTDEMEKQIDEYIHGMRRVLQTQGVTANVLDSQVPDPQNAFQTLANLISGTTEIPQRQLFGAESGQQAGEADERNFNSRARERQVNWAEPTVLRPLVNTLIRANILPNPEQGYEVEWPDLSTMTDRERADVAARIAQAISDISAQGTQRNPQVVLTPQEFRERFLPNLPPKPQGNINQASPISNNSEPIDIQSILSELGRMERDGQITSEAAQRARQMIEGTEE